MNTTCTSSAPMTCATAVAHSSYTDSTVLEEHTPLHVWHNGAHPSRVPVVSVKQEPMDTEHTSHSPNNDSGISPGHGSSGGSSIGRPSPGQNGPFSSPEQLASHQELYVTKAEHTESTVVPSQPNNYNHQQSTGLSVTPVWGINLLQHHPHNQHLASPPTTVVMSTASNSNLHYTQSDSTVQTTIPAPDYQLKNQSTSPSSANQAHRNTSPRCSPLHTSVSLRVTPMASSPCISRNTSPSQRIQTSASGSPTAVSSSDINMKTPPLADINTPPGLNPGLSDDNNSRSSSASSPSTLDGENEYYKMQSSEGQMVEQNPLRCLQMAVEQTGVATGNNGLRNTFQCPLCEFSTVSRTEFINHNRTHCPDRKCNKCDFVTKDVEQLHNHLCEQHMISPEAAESIIEGKEEQTGIRVPRVNSQGKVKTFRCKQCSFVAITKMEFWNHSRSHIKEEKLLTCPRCPFVTEYKHHLEYHLRNHANSKPFQCFKCSYSCVNKSMLNSHLKSHSTVYQYRCASCSYATKYCHSLKLHLRKYRHSPAMVLNPDGTPNPHPIIDVYGTRRGPKQRSGNPAKPGSEENNSDITYISQTALPFLQAPYGLIPQPPGDIPISYPYGPVIPGTFQTNNSNSPLMPAFPQNGSLNTQDKNNDTTNSKRNLPSENYDNLFLATTQYYHMNNNNNDINDTDAMNNMKEIVSQSPRKKQNQDESHLIAQETEELALSNNGKTAGSTPLDLSKPDALDTTFQAPTYSISPSTQTSSTSLIKITTKHRRKGQAYKLDHISRKLQQQFMSGTEDSNRTYGSLADTEERSKSPEKERNLEGPETNVREVVSEIKELDEKLPKVDVESRSASEKSSVRADSSKVFRCTYCDITFSDAVLYTMHKGYHGFQDPFKCNMCGEQTHDKVEFFLHIARSSHC